MTDDPAATHPEPYLLEDPPTSVGRLFLARAFHHYCALHFGYSGEEIARSLQEEPSTTTADNVRMAARLIGEAFARQIVRTWARPFGGGEPIQLRAGVWEVDSFDRRFATSAIDPRMPFDERARTTSWLFVDVDDWNALVEASLEPHHPAPRRRSFRLGGGALVEIGRVSDAPSTGASAGPPEDRLVRLPEVKRLTGLSRSTIYRRMEQGRFPCNVPMSGSIAAWREKEIGEWLADPS